MRKFIIIGYVLTELGRNIKRLTFFRDTVYIYYFSSQAVSVFRLSGVYPSVFVCRVFFLNVIAVDGV